MSSTISFKIKASEIKLRKQVSSYNFCGRTHRDRTKMRRKDLKALTADW